MFLSRLIASFIWFSLLSTLLYAAEPIHLRSGTGFFVSKLGHIVTNAHVVDGCDTVEIRGAVNPTEAKVISADATIDLALLQTQATPPRLAFFRGDGQTLRPRDPVLLIGYPEDSAISGQYQIVDSYITDISGPLGNVQWLQFHDAAKQGNSGGPLLDHSGNVIGVIAGKTTLTRRNLRTGREEVVQNADIAVNLEYLQRFLDQHQVFYQAADSTSPRATPYIAHAARDYIVNIRCRMG